MLRSKGVVRVLSEDEAIQEASCVGSWSSYYLGTDGRPEKCSDLSGGGVKVDLER